MLTLRKKGEKLNIQEMIVTKGGGCGVPACSICGYDNADEFMIAYEEWRNS